MRLNFRKARQDDIHHIVAMLADDVLGSRREEFSLPLPQAYLSAFDVIDADPHQELIVVEDKEMIIGTMQLSLITYLTYRGGRRAQIEAVRIHKDYRNQGIGKKMINWAINRAREQNAHVIQLTTDKQRPAAIAFYRNLGFEATHEGMKLHL